MRFQKPLVIAAFACLTAFFGVESFAQENENDQRGRLAAKILQNSFTNAGYAVKRRGRVLEVLVASDGLLRIKLPKTFDDMVDEDGGIVTEVDGQKFYQKVDDPQNDPDLIRLQQCVARAEAEQNIANFMCKFMPQELKELFCRTGAFLELVAGYAKCYALYLNDPADLPPPEG